MMTATTSHRLIKQRYVTKGSYLSVMTKLHYSDLFISSHKKKNVASVKTDLFGKWIFRRHGDASSTSLADDLYYYIT